MDTGDKDVWKELGALRALVEEIKERLASGDTEFQHIREGEAERWRQFFELRDVGFPQTYAVLAEVEDAQDLAASAKAQSSRAETKAGEALIKAGDAATEAAKAQTAKAVAEAARAIAEATRAEVSRIEAITKVAKDAVAEAGETSRKKWTLVIAATGLGMVVITNLLALGYFVAKVLLAKGGVP